MSERHPAVLVIPGHDRIHDELHICPTHPAGQLHPCPNCRHVDPIEGVDWHELRTNLDSSDPAVRKLAIILHWFATDPQHDQTRLTLRLHEAGYGIHDNP